MEKMGKTEKLINTIDTKTTDSWGAEWDEMETARDFIQNFFDANDIDKIKIEIYGKTVKISAPAEFDYRSLIYLWSDKANDPESIGQYGEGFKVSVLNAMRNWGCGVEFYVANHKLEYYFKNIDISSKGARAIMCRHYEIDAIQGSCLVVSNCTKRLIEAFEFGLKHFYHKDNPKNVRFFSVLWPDDSTLSFRPQLGQVESCQPAFGAGVFRSERSSQG